MDPAYECLVLLVLTVFYGAIGAVVWLIFCRGRFCAVEELNRILKFRPSGTPESARMNELDSMLRILEDEGRISREFSRKLRRIAPVWYHDRWVSYPSNDYWSFRYEKMVSPE